MIIKKLGFSSYMLDIQLLEVGTSFYHLKLSLKYRHNPIKEFLSAICIWSNTPTETPYHLKLRCVKRFKDINHFWTQITFEITGWPKSKFANSNGYSSENTHFWPYVDKAKMCFGGLHLLLVFSCLFTIFSCLFTI